MADAPPDITVQLSNATAEEISIYYRSPNGTRVRLDPVVPCGCGDITLVTSPGAYLFYFIISFYFILLIFGSVRC
jgi:hypothetical protein